MVRVGTGNRDIQVVLGLGNPGARYRATRHNLGHRVVDLLASRWDLRLKRKEQARVGWRRQPGGPVLLAKPIGYMNESGAAARFVAAYWNMAADRFFVMLDDTALPLGCLRIRRSGSDGGHRGLRSVLEALGTDRVPRLRMGVGRHQPEGDMADHVLDRFDPDERPLVEQMIAAAADCVESVLRDGLTPAMNEFNRFEPDPGPPAGGRARQGE